MIFREWLAALVRESQQMNKNVQYVTDHAVSDGKVPEDGQRETGVRTRNATDDRTETDIQKEINQ